MALSRAAEWTWVLGAYLLLQLSFASFQPVTTRNGGLAYDGQQYFAMARQTPRDLPPKAAAPFVYRVGTPMLAAAVAKSFDWVLAVGFDRVNAAAALATLILLTVWLQRHVVDAAPRLTVVMFFMVSPYAPMRFANHYPITVDPAGLLFIMAGLLALDWLADRPTTARAAAVALLVGVGVAFREVVLVVGVMALVLRTAQGRTFLSFAWLPLAGGLVVLVAVRMWAVAVETPSDYSTLGEMLRWSREKSLVQYLVAWFLVFGPLLTLVLIHTRTSLRMLKSRPDWLVGLAVGALAALLGGSDTERLLVFISPLVLLLMAQALSRSGFSLSSPVTAGFILAQLASSRVFLPIGAGPVTPSVVGTEWNRLPSDLAWLSTYDSLWTQFCGPDGIRFYLLWFGALAVAIVAASRLVERGRAAETG